MKRRIPFRGWTAHHVELVRDGLAIIVSACVDHIGPAAAVKLTVIVSHYGEPILTIGSEVLRLESEDMRRLETFSFSVNGQQFRVHFSKPSLAHEWGLFPKYMYVSLA